MSTALMPQPPPTLAEIRTWARAKHQAFSEDLTDEGRWIIGDLTGIARSQGRVAILDELLRLLGDES